MVSKTYTVTKKEKKERKKERKKGVSQPMSVYTTAMAPEA
jgi:hypothetical protein